MANWCSNYVNFTGPTKNILALDKFIKEMDERSNKQQCGVLPIFQEAAEDGYYFDIYYDNGDIDETEEFSCTQVQYSTKWNPNQDNVLLLAAKLQLSFELSYEESGNNMYGQYQMSYDPDEEDQILEHRCLTDDEIESCHYLVDENEENPIPKDKISEEEWDRYIDELNWEVREDYEKMEDLLGRTEWENVN